MPLREAFAAAATAAPAVSPTVNAYPPPVGEASGTESSLNAYRVLDSEAARTAFAVQRGLDRTTLPNPAQ